MAGRFAKRGFLSLQGRKNWGATGLGIEDFLAVEGGVTRSTQGWGKANRLTCFISNPLVIFDYTVRMLSRYGPAYLRVLRLGSYKIVKLLVQNSLICTRRAVGF
ncbi:hypothetical protein THH46_14110 [Pseudomonas sp. NA13]